MKKNKPEPTWNKAELAKAFLLSSLGHSGNVMTFWTDKFEASLKKTWKEKQARRDKHGK